MPHAPLLSVARWLGLAALVLAVLPACGEDPAPRPPRLAVIQRGLTWTRDDPGRAFPPLSTAWDLSAEGEAGGESDAEGDAGTAGWRLAPGTTARPAPADEDDAGDAPPNPAAATGEPTPPGDPTPDDPAPDGASSTPRLVLAGRSELAIDGPGGDPELHRWLIVRVVPEEAQTLRVFWKATGERFDDAQASSAFPLPERDDVPATLAIPIDTLRGVRGAADAREAFDRVRLVFGGEPGRPVRVRLDDVHFVSELDEAEGGLVAGTFEREGDRRAGHAVRLPAELSVPLGDVRAGERLRLSLALAGAADDVSLQLTGFGDSRTIALQPGRPWHDVALESTRAQPDATLTLSATGADPNAVLFVSAALRLAPPAADDARPSVLLYVEDTLRADRLGTYGYAFDTDPWLQRAAAEGVVFERVLAASNWTRPAISTLLTSLEPARHGNRSHRDKVSADAVTLAEAFADAGWVTASFVTNYHAGVWSGLDQGFDVHREPTADGASALASTLTSAAVAASLEGFLERHADERVFVWVHTLDPHEPYEPPDAERAALEPTSGHRERVRAPGYKGLDAESIAYDAEILHNDNQLARLDATLQRLGLRHDMLFAFTSDHGEAFGEHGQARHRQTLHAEEVHVPLVLRWPAGLPAGVRVRDWVGHLDLAPTLAGLAGVPLDPGWRGRDLSTAARGLGDPREQPQLSDVHYDTPRAGGPVDELAVVRGELKLLAGLDADGEPVARALYDLSGDPGEHDDLLPARRSSPEVAAMLDWLRAAWRDGREAASGGDASPMDPAMREWMIQMGYLQATDR